MGQAKTGRRIRLCHFWRYIERLSALWGNDIIYVDGSQVNAPQWQFGLLKGHITRTIFDGHYDLVWIDAMFAPLPNNEKVLIDVKSVLEKTKVEAKGYRYWRL